MFSDPVVGADFFGREDILEILKKRMDAFRSGYRQNIALIGHRELGKTSILHHFIYSYRGEEMVLVYVELKPQALDYFVDQFIRSLLYQYLRRRSPLHSMESFELLAETAQAYIPHTVARSRDVMRHLKEGDTEEAFARLFELTSFLHAETGLKCVVVLDEFHRLGDFAVKNAFQSFGKRIMVQKDTLYLISSSSFTASLSILAEKLSLLFGNFERVYLKPFTFEVSFRFIEKKLEPLAMEDGLARHLVSLTDGHPFFLNVILREFKLTAMSESRECVDKEIFVQCLRRLLFDADGVLNQYFLAWIAPWTSLSRRGNFLTLLTELAKGNNRLKVLSLAIKRSPSETLRMLKELMEEELVARNGSFYYFPNKMFQFWLRYVYQKKEMSLLVNHHAKAAEFLSECTRAIDAFLEESKQSPLNRIMGLVRSFQDEKVEFENKGRMLPSFTEVKSWGADSAENVKTFIAERGGHCWICQVSHERATEREVLEFVQRTSKLPSQRAKRILFAVQGMDANAKLLAKNKNVWTLSLEKINALMDLYSRNKIVPRQGSDESAAAAKTL